MRSSVLVRSCNQNRADEGVGRGPGGPPYISLRSVAADTEIGQTR
jgi:hypothetical protein